MIKNHASFKVPSHTKNSLKSEVYDQDDDTIPIMGNKQRKTSTMIVKSIPPTPLDVSTLLSCKINYLVVLFLLIPSLIYSQPSLLSYNSTYMQEILYGPVGRISSTTQHDIITMAWTHFLVAIAGAFTPVLHLLCDDWVSTLGLETLRSFHLGSTFDRYHGTKAFFQRICLEPFRKRDPVYTSNTALHEPPSSVKGKRHEYMFVSHMKKKSYPLQPEEFFDELEDKLKKKKRFKAANDILIDNKNGVTSFSKTTDAAKRKFPPIREIEESEDIKNLCSAKNSAYDDLIELKDDLHYL